MIHIEVDYEGERSFETYSFTATDTDYQAKLDELEKYPGKVDGIRIYIGSDSVTTTWDQNPKEVLVKTTNVGLAVRRGRTIKYPR